MQEQQKEMALSGIPHFRRAFFLSIFVAIGCFSFASFLINPDVLDHFSSNVQDGSGENGESGPPSPENFHPRKVLPELPAIDQFNIIPAKDIGTQIEEGELVIGVIINGKARDYPLNMMTGPQREVFNDVLGDRPIAATW
jgi:hypothetical protein